MAMIKPYIARDDAEAKALRDGTWLVLLIPLDPQPVMGRNNKAVIWKLDGADVPFERRREVAPGLLSLCSGSKRAFRSAVLEYCPYAPGDRIAVKEAWSRVPIGKRGRMGYIYRADGEEAFAEITEGWEFMGEWEPPETLPQKGVRTCYVTHSTSCTQEMNGKWCWNVEVERK